MSTYVYEVNILGPVQIEKKYLSWLQKHINEMLELPVFTKAEQTKINISEDCFGVRVKYFLNSPTDLKDYLKNYSDKMRNQIDPELLEQLQFFRCNYFA